MPTIPDNIVANDERTHRMTRIQDQAKITFAGVDTHVTDRSPLQDQVVVVWQAMRRRADAEAWPRRPFEGTTGHAGPLVAKQLVRTLFPDADRDRVDVLSSLINQVLRKVNAARCLRQPTPNSDELPIWFVSETMPENIVPVAIYVSKHGHAVSRPALPPTRGEAKVTSHEAGEDRTPEPVQVSQRSDNLDTYRQQRRDEREAAIQDAYEAVASHAQPLSALEVATLVDTKVTRRGQESIVRGRLNELVRRGKVFARTETRQERRLRLGGTPVSRSAVLYSTNMPVPRRTEANVVEGVRHIQTLEDIDAGRSERDDKVLDCITKYGRGQHVSGEHGITTMTGLSIDQVRASTKRLKSLGLIFQSKSSTWMLEDWRKRTRTDYGPPTSQSDSQPNLVPLVSYETDAESVDDTDATETEIGDQIVRLTHRLVHLIVDSDQTRVAELEAENERLKAQVTSLRETLRLLA